MDMRGIHAAALPLRLDALVDAAGEAQAASSSGGSSGGTGSGSPLQRLCEQVRGGAAG